MLERSEDRSLLISKCAFDALFQPLVLGLSKGERFYSWFDKLTTSGRFESINPPAQVPSYFGGAGLANLAASIGTFACISLSSTFSIPSNHVNVHLNGIFTPATSR